MEATRQRPGLDAQTAIDPRSIAIQPDEIWPFYDEDEIEAVCAVLRSGKVNQWTGNDVADFQHACDSHFGSRGVALANGTLALELALRVFGIGPGDEVIVTPRSFAASALCVMMAGATPVFAEVDRDSGNLTAETIAEAITERTRAVIPVHLGGWPADMLAIMELAAERGLKVIEDCAQAHGAAIAGRPVGSFGHAAAFSFCQDKIISTGGEGGYTSFRDPDHWQQGWSFKDHGKNWDKVQTPPLEPGFRWLHDGLGTNWRLTGPQAAIGLMQLKKLQEWTQLRERNAKIWANALSSVAGLRVPHPEPHVQHAFYKLYAYVDAAEDQAPLLRAEILRRAEKSGLRVFSGSCSEIYLEEAFRHLPAPDLPVARLLGAQSLMTEVHPTLHPDRLQARAECLATIAADVLG